MKALSVKQPWAWLICNGYKDIENRNWRNNWPGRIYIHASKKIDDSCWDLIRDRLQPYSEVWDLLRQTEFIFNLPLGAIVGEVDIVGCVTESESPWFWGKYGFVLRNPIAYKIPIACRGMPRFFDPGIAQNA